MNLTILLASAVAGAVIAWPVTRALLASKLSKLDAGQEQTEADSFVSDQGLKLTGRAETYLRTQKERAS